MCAEDMEIQASKNGPYIVKGEFILVDGENKEIEHQNTVYLCRCGGSQKKPFCDGTHRKISFQG